MRTRVIPSLLLKSRGLVKGVSFEGHRYVGDPRNAVKIFNEKEVDELLLLDIGVPAGAGPDESLIREIVTEAFMPVAYGGGLRNLEQCRRIAMLGVEKLVLNTAAVDDPGLVRQLADTLGSQAVVVAIDCRPRRAGSYEVYVDNGRRPTGLHPVDHATAMERAGAGELLVTSIVREGTCSGYDLALTRQIADAVGTPLIASGGAGSIEDFASAVREGHASAVAAGSLFVFHGRHRAVLISYPDRLKLEEVLE